MTFTRRDGSPQCFTVDVSPRSLAHVVRFVIAWSASFLAASTAHAQQVDGRFLVSLDGTLVSYEQANRGSVGGFSSGATAESINGGILGGGFGLGLAGGASEHVVAGARAHLSISKLSASSGSLQGGETEYLQYRLIPYIEAVMGQRGKTLRPFLGLMAGMSGSAVNGSDSTGFLGGGMLGFHAFAADRASIDVQGNGYGVVGAGEGTDYTGFGVGIQVSITGWFGGATHVENDDEARDAGATAPTLTTVGARSTSSTAPLRVRVTFENGRIGTLIGNPHHTSGVVMVQVQLKRDEIEGCKGGSLVVNGQRTGKVKVGSHGATFGAATVQARFAIQSLPKRGKEHALHLCNRTLTFTEESSQKLRSFRRAYESSARRAGTWTADADEAWQTDEERSDEQASPENGSDDADGDEPEGDGDEEEEEEEVDESDR